jgi:hypothetical protein
VQADHDVLCKRCGAVLTAASSVARGYGAQCFFLTFGFEALAPRTMIDIFRGAGTEGRGPRRMSQVRRGLQWGAFADELLPPDGELLAEQRLELADRVARELRSLRAVFGGGVERS